MSDPIKPRIDFAQPLEADKEQDWKAAHAFQ
ncbi:Uncharacterised protein [Cedecea neteri]|uniref:Uncharacterized protein n=1 Tax=Cedecea neteri TaxID=158822 RepID=A0A2X3J8T9_9ENTR|nr:Uncharacterised protein [Cedecea neteri]